MPGCAAFPFEPPPNWKDPVEGVEEAPKLKEGVDACPFPPDAKGLLKDEPDDALLVKLTAALAGLSLLVEPAPNIAGVLAFAAGVEEAKMLLEAVVCELLPKLNTGAAELRLLLPVNAFFAGDASSCFIGLPSNMEVVGALDGGDLGPAPNSFGAFCDKPLGLSLEVLPKLNAGAAVG